VDVYFTSQAPKKYDEIGDAITDYQVVRVNTQTRDEGRFTIMAFAIPENIISWVEVRNEQSYKEAEAWILFEGLGVDTRIMMVLAEAYGQETDRYFVLVPEGIEPVHPGTYYICVTDFGSREIKTATTVTILGDDGHTSGGFSVGFEDFR